MRKIKEFKISLMQKDDKKELTLNNKAKFIIKHSATLNIKNLIEINKEYKNYYDNDYSEFISESASLIYNDLNNVNKQHKIDSIGIWIIFENGEFIDNSIPTSVLDDIKKYSMDDSINPIKEFIKMTLNEI